MKVLNRISYSEDVDILMIQLSDKKVDDAYDADNMIVQVDKKGEPVLLEIFQGKKFLKNMELLMHKSLSKNIQKEVLFTKTPFVVAHDVKLKKK